MTQLPDEQSPEEKIAHEQLLLRIEAINEDTQLLEELRKSDDPFVSMLARLNLNLVEVTKALARDITGVRDNMNKVARLSTMTARALDEHETEHAAKLQIDLKNLSKR